MRPPHRPRRARRCEAVGQARLEEILRDALDTRLPERLDRVRARQQRQRAAVRRLLNGGAS